MDKNLEELIAEFTQLVSPPDTWVKINEVLSDRNATTSDMAEIIQLDPGLTASILKIVNSAYYNLRAGVDTVTRAIAVIGTNDLYSLATAITAAETFSRVPCHLTSPEIFWQHSIGTGILAKKLAGKCSVLNTERLYVAGLLHDIGSLVLYSRFPEESSEALMIANGDEEVLYGAENDIFGFNHAMVSAGLLKMWRMPDTLVSAVGFHHEPVLAGKDSIDAAIVCMANHVANMYGVSAFMEDASLNPADLNPEIWEITQLEEDVLDELMEDYEDNLASAIAVMLPATVARTSY